MLPDLLRILIAALVCWCLFIAVDIWFRLPESGGVSGAHAIGKEIENGGGALHGGFMMGNIVSSPDASAGTLLASVGVFIAGIPGGLLAAALVYVGNRICSDPGYAGTTGTVLATFVVFGFTQIGFFASDFIAGMVLAILSIQGLSHLHASRVLNTFWGWRS
jgi:energy-converting hydrogenase A subunit B